MSPNSHRRVTSPNWLGYEEKLQSRIKLNQELSERWCRRNRKHQSQLDLNLENKDLRRIPCGVFLGQITGAGRVDRGGRRDGSIGVSRGPRRPPQDRRRLLPLELTRRSESPARMARDERLRGGSHYSTGTEHLSALFCLSSPLSFVSNTC